ncbi:unnamed protein product [Cercopithifilaria johnstoni]|uniref:Uncharacterized protein n=1 Tax=Cercopithifilaria johnstoni TaxID=2874296 RepID=A0A8J2M3H1_9BILA|nr:unnamed protein product [Cercopithifilaria johnstoni]
MALEGDVRRRMMMMNNRMHRPSMPTSPSYSPFQRPTYPVSSVILSPRIPSDVRSPKSLSDGSITNSSSSCASSLQHHFHGGPVQKFGNKSENGNGNSCTILTPRDQLCKTFSSWSPTSLISNSGNSFENFGIPTFEDENITALLCRILPKGLNCFS